MVVLAALVVGLRALEFIARFSWKTVDACASTIGIGDTVYSHYGAIHGVIVAKDSQNPTNIEVCTFPHTHSYSRRSVPAVSPPPCE